MNRIVLTIVAAVFLAKMAQATELRATPFTYEYGVAQDYTSEQEHVICDGCPKSRKLSAALKLPPLTARLSQEQVLPQVALVPSEECTAHSSDKREQGKLEKLATIHFKFNDASLSAQEQENLVKLAALVKPQLGEGVAVKISGFTCDLGAKGYNDGLALRRAQAAGSFLQKQGVTLIETIGTGKCCYLSETDRPANRRAEITLWRKTDDAE